MPHRIVARTIPCPYCTNEEVNHTSTQGEYCPAQNDSSTNEYRYHTDLPTQKICTNEQEAWRRAIRTREMLLKLDNTTAVCLWTPDPNKGIAVEPRGSTLRGHEKSMPNILVDNNKHARKEQEALRRACPALRALGHAFSTRIFAIAVEPRSSTIRGHKQSMPRV